MSEPKRIREILQAVDDGDCVTDLEIETFLDVYDLEFIGHMFALGPQYKLAAANLVHVTNRMKEWQKARRRGV